jgi:Phage integrase, N-terminal SAM-like domain
VTPLVIPSQAEGSLTIQRLAPLLYSRPFRVAEDPPPSTASPAPRKLLERVRWHLRVKHYSIRTEQAYVDWIRRFILFHKKRHPDQMGHVKASLTCRSQLRFGDVLGLCFAFACGRRALHQLHSQLTKAHIAT